MPIKDLTDSVRLPRLGKIHLGIKALNSKGVEFPQKTDYFVFPKEYPDYQKVVELFGEEPKELNILIPVEDEEQWATQYYRSYNLTYGLVCKGDGEKAIRMVDIQTKELPVVKTAGTVTMIETDCLGEACPIYKNKARGKPQCHVVMNLRFFIPELPGLGVWQIDTGSKNSILNINNSAKLIKKTFGRVSFIPLKLTLEPTPVNNPEDGKKQTIYALNLRTDVTLAQLADRARKQAKMLMIEAPDLGTIYDAAIEEEIDDLWGERKVIPTEQVKNEEALPQDKLQSKSSPLKTEAGPRTSTRLAEGDKSKQGSTKITSEVKPRSEWEKVTQEEVPNYLKLEVVFHNLTGKQPKEMYAELGVWNRHVAVITAWEAFTTLMERFAPKE